ncbi:MAG: FtsX-like permease family protein [Pseudomonadota bacterium]
MTTTSLRYKLSLALRFLVRDWRSGELSVLIAALIVAVASSTAISLFGDRLQRTMSSQAAEFLAADMVVRSHDPLPEEWRATALQSDLKTAQTSEFVSVVIEKEELLLAGIKAVSPGYPLRGYLKTTTSDYAGEVKTVSIPDAGAAWVEKRILSALKLSLGDSIEVGEKRLRITRLITYEPDKRGDYYSLAPRIIINLSDLEATGVLQPGSHVHNYFLFAGDEQNLLRFKRWLKPQLAGSQRIVDIHEDRPEVGNALTRAQRYLGLSSIVVILIAGVAIAMAARRYTERHFDNTAILRCLGSGQRDILTLYVLQFLTAGTLASAIGCALGWLTQDLFFYMLKPLLPQKLAMASPVALSLGFATGMVTLFGFALPPILRLKQVSPLRVLRRDLVPVPSSAWLVYGLALAIIAVLIWRYTEDFKLSFYIIAVGLATLTALSLIIFAMLKLSRKLLPRLGLAWRFGLQNLGREPKASISQILAFSIVLIAMIISVIVRTDLLDAWKAQLPADAPNHFALNIFSRDIEPFKQTLAADNVRFSRFYPVVRGRLAEINGEPVKKIVSKDSRAETAINRDLSLTWSKDIPEGNKVVRGRWWDDSAQQRRVSVERKLAQSMGLRLKDTLTFTVASEQFTATVASFRSLEWDTMRPNFYMMFSPGSLEGFPHTYITSFFLGPDEKLFLNRLVRQFPSITILEVDLLLEQFRTILGQITQAINYVLVFALMAGLTVLFAAVHTTLDSRLYDGALLRTLGANRRLLRRSHLIEFVVLGALSGLLAALVAEIITWVLYSQVLEMDYTIKWMVWLITPLIGATVVGISGYWGTRGIVNKSPMRVLREL